jgi:excisionase family DNA binding protein
MTIEDTDAALARVLIPLPGIGTLSLHADTYRTALAEGAAQTNTGTPGGPDNEPLFDATELAAVLDIPVTWLEQAAREGRIPSLQFGRWRRFRRSEVEAAVRTKSP